MQVDVVVSPARTVLLGIGSAAYPLVMGDMNLLKLLHLLRPKVLVPLLNAEIDQKGPLASLIIERGDLAQLQVDLISAGLNTRVEFAAPPSESMAVAL